jgi:AraC family transcriptional regulator, positive regulator of tynA and feaB
MTAAHLALNEPALPLQTVSTSGIKLSERHEFWEAGARFLFGALTLEELSRDTFDANFSYTAIGDLIFCRLSASSPHRVSRTETVAAHDDRPFLKAVLQIGGRSVITQSDRTVSLCPGEWTVYDAGQPYIVAASAGAEFSMLLVPRARVASPGFDLRGLVLRRFPADRGLGKLIWNLVGNAVDQILELQYRSSFDLGEIVAQMTRLAILDSLRGPDAEDAPLNSRDQLRERVKFYISAHLADPELSIEKLAALARCSKRYLHMIFRPENRSISDYIVQARLARCREDLLDPRHARRSITEIAYGWGFNSSNHFSRCFKREFGMSPRTLRAESVWPTRDMTAARKPA